MATGEVLSEPATVKIAGTQSALLGINKISIPEDQINISGQNSDVTEVVNLKDFLPDNVKLAEMGFNGKTTVTVKIEPIVEKTLEVPVENINIINIPTDMEAKLSEDIKYFTVQVSGLDAQITPLRQNMVQGKIDVAAWMEEQEITELSAGIYTIPVTLDLENTIIREELTARVIFS